MKPVTPAPHPLTVVIGLGITQVIGFGTLYYAFGVVADDIARDTGFSIEAVYGIFSLALLAGGLAAPRIGRLLDEIGAARTMTVGSVFVTFAVLGMALSTSKWFVAGFIVLTEILASFVLYEAAFVAAARLVPENPRRTITGITLLGGFASTVFWPATAFLAEAVGWRSTYVCFAALHLFIAAPLHFWLARYAEQNTPPIGAAKKGGDARTPGTPSHATFLMLIIGFTATSFLIAAVHLHLIRTLELVGMGVSAALIGALIGPFQVLGRIVEFTLSARISIFAVGIFSAAAMPIAVAVLMTGAPAHVAGIAFAVLFGAGQGLNYIVRGVLPLALYGSARLGSILGIMNGIRLFVTAAAPFVFAIMIERFGAMSALTLAVAVGLVGLSAFILLAAWRPRGD